jgi:hypothetical protein
MSTAHVSIEEIGQQFIDAFNRRDAEDLVALVDPDVDFHPTGLVGTRRAYRGHEGMRRWVSDLKTSQAMHQVRVHEVRALEERRFLVLTEVILDGESASPAALLGRLGDTGKIVEAHAYLSDEELLTQIGLVHNRPTSADPS